MNPRMWRLGLGLILAAGPVVSGQSIPQYPFTRGGSAGAEPGMLPLPEIPSLAPPPEAAGAVPGALPLPGVPALPAGLPVVPPQVPSVGAPPAPTPVSDGAPQFLPPATPVQPGVIPGLAPSSAPAPTLAPLPLPPLPTAPIPPPPSAPPTQALSIPIPTPPAVPPVHYPFAPPPPPAPAVVPLTLPPVTTLPAPPPVPPPKMIVIPPPPGGASIHLPPPPGAFALPPARPAATPTPAPSTTAGATPAAPAAASDKAFDAVWNNGLFVKSKDGNFSAHVGGTIHYDGAWYTGGQGVQRFPGGVGQFGDGANLRRMRIYMEGTMYKDFDYKFELEFMNGFSPAGLTGPVGTNTVSNSPGPTDAWVQAKNVPFLGNVRIGSQKEWFSLEHLENYRALMYMERSYLFDFAQPTAFNNGFSPGISAFNAWEQADKRLFTAVGVYKNESDLGGYGVGDGNYAVTGRVAGLPIWDPDNLTYWHVGGAMSHRDPVAGQAQVRIRNEVRNAPFPLLNLIANTGVINADSQTLYNLETAAAFGSLTLSAEYTANLLNGARVGAAPSVGTLAYQGFYVQGMYFLTGEHRAWDQNVGFFKRVVPLNNFSPGHGTWGAWEVGARYTYLNLDDKGINGGRLNNVTLGTTWYWNPNVRLQFNYDYVYRDGGPNPLAKGAIHSLGTRLAMDF